MHWGYTGKEISEITGIPRYTISRRLSKLEKYINQNLIVNKNGLNKNVV